MARGSDNPFPSILVVEGTTPASPAAGDQRLFVDSADHKLKRVNSAGAVTSIEGAATAFSGAKVYASAGISIPSATWTLATWDSEEFDTDLYHDTVTNNGRITVPTGMTGYYRVGCCIAVTGLTANARFLTSIFLNGNPGVGTVVRGTAVEIDVVYNATTNDYPAVNIDAPVHLNASDYITTGLYQSSGASATLDQAKCAFWITKIG